MNENSIACKEVIHEGDYYEDIEMELIAWENNLTHEGSYTSFCN